MGNRPSFTCLRFCYTKMDTCKYQLAGDGDSDREKCISNARTLLVTLGILLSSATVAGFLGWFLYIFGQRYSTKFIQVGMAKLDIIKEKERELTIHNGTTDTLILQGYLGRHIPKRANFDYRNCNFQITDNGGWQDCHDVIWPKYAKVRLKHKLETGIHCYNIQWEATSCNKTPLVDCLSLKGHWYVGSDAFGRQWPLRIRGKEIDWITECCSKRIPHFRKEFRVDPGAHYWLSSSGVALITEEPIHLLANITNKAPGEICLGPKDTRSHPGHTSNPSFSYTLCQGTDIKTLHQYMSKHYLSKYLISPEDEFFRDPIFPLVDSSNNLSVQSQANGLADDIFKHGWNRSLIFMDYTWRHIDESLNLTAFQNNTSLRDTIAQKGAKIVVSVKPYFSVRTSSLHTRDIISFLLQSPWGNAPALFKLHDDIVAVLNTDDIKSVTWFLRRSAVLKSQLQVSSILIDTANIIGDSLPFLLPKSGSFYQNLIACSLEFSSSTCTILGTPHYHDLHVLPKNHINYLYVTGTEASWPEKLQNIIPAALRASLLGNAFFVVLPYAKGATQAQITEQSKSHKEFYIRWLEAVALFPLLYIPIPPWRYGAKVVTLSHKLLDLRRKFLPQFLELSKKITGKGEPFIRPLWWHSPFDGTALKISDEFMVGDDLLVAPVLEAGATERNVYLPQGRWWDHLRKRPLAGSQWYHHYSAELYELPHFTKISVQQH